MPTPGPLEIVILLVIVLLIFGPKRLPDLGRSLGRGMREFKDSVTGKDADDVANSGLKIDNANRIEITMLEHFAAAIAHAPHAVSTVGVLNPHPGSRNVIPGAVSMTVDFRHPADTVLSEMKEALSAAIERICTELKLTAEVLRCPAASVIPLASISPATLTYIGPVAGLIALLTGCTASRAFRRGEGLPGVGGGRPL